MFEQLLTNRVLFCSVQLSESVHVSCYIFNVKSVYRAGIIKVHLRDHETDSLARYDYNIELWCAQVRINTLPS